VSGMALETYEEAILFKMYDCRIIGNKGYKSIEEIQRFIKWDKIRRQYQVRKKFKNVLRGLIGKGYIDDHGKSGKVASLSPIGTAYVHELISNGRHFD